MTEYHIASLIVRSRPEALYASCQAIGDIQGAEVHATDLSGKIIVTAEGNDHQAIAGISDQIRDIAGVVDVAAVYHEYAPEASDPSLKQ